MKKPCSVLTLAVFCKLPIRRESSIRNMQMTEKLKAPNPATQAINGQESRVSRSQRKSNPGSVNTYMGKCSTFISAQEGQTKTTQRSNHIPLKMTTKRRNGNKWPQGMGQRSPHTLLMELQTCTATLGKQSGDSSQEWSVFVPQEKKKLNI